MTSRTCGRIRTIPNELAFAWVVDFPMFEKNDDGTIQAAHHPFCSIKEEDVDKFMKGEDLFNIRANSYDLVLNGYELSSGSIRIHKADMQQKVFELLNISPEMQQQKVWPHAPGVQVWRAAARRVRAGHRPHGDAMMNEPNIREVIPFPKTGEGKDLMMGSPSEVDKKQLDELGLEIKKSPEKK